MGRCDSRSFDAPDWDPSAFLRSRLQGECLVPYPCCFPVSEGYTSVARASDIRRRTRPWRTRWNRSIPLPPVMHPDRRNAQPGRRRSVAQKPCGRGESNPRFKLGKLTYYLYTTPAEPGEQRNRIFGFWQWQRRAVHSRESAVTSLSVPVVQGAGFRFFLLLGTWSPLLHRIDLTCVSLPDRNLDFDHASV